MRAMRGPLVGGRRAREPPADGGGGWHGLCLNGANGDKRCRLDGLVDASDATATDGAIGGSRKSKRESTCGSTGRG